LAIPGAYPDHHHSLLAWMFGPEQSTIRGWRHVSGAESGVANSLVFQYPTKCERKYCSPQPERNSGIRQTRHHHELGLTLVDTPISYLQRQFDAGAVGEDGS